jgi:hypothetical protein
VTDGGHQLGKWVNNQRQARRKGRLSTEQQDRLDALPGWTWNWREANWEEGFTHLEGFVTEEGHARVPQSQVADDGYRLGAWVNNQRQARRNGELSTARADRLGAVDGWMWDARIGS